jgi:phosphate transport system substrate-binding protein
MKRMNNDVAVSPIVATLVLIVVAVIGAVAVGTIMGTFSTDVSKKASADQASSASSTEILIAGSTTVQPASELLAKAYMANHPGIKITVQGGGSGAGIAAANNGLVDIGSASKAVSTTDYPDLNVYQIGGSAVVVIAGKDATTTAVSADELKALYQDGTAIGGITKAVQRSEDSGTEETFAKFIKYTNSAGQLNTTSSAVSSATGNPGVLKAVEDGGANTLGFVDYGFAKDDSKVQILNITVSGSDYQATSNNILASLKGTADDSTKTYVNSLTRPLNYLTKGTPNSVVKNYIDFCRSPGATELFDDVGYFSYVQIAA